MDPKKSMFLMLGLYGRPRPLTVVWKTLTTIKSVNIQSPLTTQELNKIPNNLSKLDTILAGNHKRRVNEFNVTINRTLLSHINQCNITAQLHLCVVLKECFFDENFIS